MAFAFHFTKELQDFSLDINLSSLSNCHGILGPSGCGKSLTLKCIAGIERPDQGQISLNNKILFDSDKKINIKAQFRKVGYLFQNYALFPHMTVEENIAVGLVNFTRELRKEKVAREIKHFHLKGLEKRYPRELSGGQQQRVALARLFAYQPDILLMDEPFSALDSFLKELLQEQLLDIMKDFSKDIILVTHSREEAYRFCGSLSILHHGKVISQGLTKDIFQHPENISTAKFLGCRNFSRIKKIDDFCFDALDWGVRLTTTNRIGNDSKHVAFFSSALMDRDTSTSLNNAFLLELVSMHESIDLIHYTFLRPNHTEHHPIYCTRPKSDPIPWISSSQQGTLYLPSDQLLMLQ